MENARDKIRALGEQFLNERNKIGGPYRIFQHLDDSCCKASEVAPRETIHPPRHTVAAHSLDIKMREARSQAES